MQVQKIDQNTMQTQELLQFVLTFFFLYSLNFHTFVLTTTTTLHLHLQVHSELSLQVVNMI